jgi:ABC-type transport system involved in cytochrome c biogenesis ATPase subunit
MIDVFRIILLRDLKVSLRRWSDVFTSLIFFILVCLIFPLTAGDDQTHKNGLLAELTGKENLEYTLGISTGEKEKLRIIEGFNLTAFMDQLAGKLSHGQRRKIALSKIVQSGKILWILDEPFANLDGKGTAFLISEIQSHLNHGGMLISTENTDQPIIDSDINFNLDAP